MKRTLSIVVILLVALTACKHSAKRINDNLTIIEDKDGDSIKEDDFFVITYTETTQGGKVVGGSGEYDVRPAMMFRERSYFKGDFFDMIGHLTEGDSARFKINMDSMVKAKQFRPQGATGKYLFYNVRINKVVGRGTKSDSLYNLAIQAERKVQNDNARQGEQAKIDNFISKNKLQFQKTPLGVYYRVVHMGSGSLPALKDSVLVNYTACTLTNKMFETTDSVVAKAAGIYKPIHYGPIKLPVIKQHGPNISGFMEAVSMFPKGTKVDMLLPSRLAYGAENYHMLQPYTAVLCELEVVDIEPAVKKP